MNLYKILFIFFLLKITKKKNILSKSNLQLIFDDYKTKNIIYKKITK